jgi:hypothetical protein
MCWFKRSNCTRWLSVNTRLMSARTCTRSESNPRRWARHNYRIGSS